MEQLHHTNHKPTEPHSDITISYTPPRKPNGFARNNSPPLADKRRDIHPFTNNYVVNIDQVH